MAASQAGPRLGVVELVEPLERLEQAVLHGVLRVLTHQPPGDPDQTR
jgi:hypothetical protein